MPEIKDRWIKRGRKACAVTCTSVLRSLQVVVVASFFCKLDLPLRCCGFDFEIDEQILRSSTLLKIRCAG